MPGLRKAQAGLHTRQAAARQRQVPQLHPVAGERQATEAHHAQCCDEERQEEEGLRVELAGLIHLALLRLLRVTRRDIQINRGAARELQE